MSQKPLYATSRLPSNSHLPGRRKPVSRFSSLGLPTDGRASSIGPSLSRRASVAGLTSGPKSQRSSKTTHKLVVLPSAPQTRPFLTDVEDDLTLGHEADGGVREYKSQAERMTKFQRKEAGYKRITAYCVAESFKMKLLSSFLKREHNVSPRAFDEALYVMYHLPLLPGYGPNTNVRSSAATVTKTGESRLAHLSEAEENGYQGTYFTSPPERSEIELREGYISSSSPVNSRSRVGGTPAHFDGLLSHTETDTETEHERERERGHEHEYEPGILPELETPISEIVPGTSYPNVDIDPGAETDPGVYPQHGTPDYTLEQPSHEASQPQREDDVAEVVFFEYGVLVFFGLKEQQEKDIIEDIEKAGILKRKIEEEDWEIEECHFTHDPHIAYPRIYNDFFTLKSRSHLLKLSIAHALAQSTLLARYETTAQRVLSSPLSLSIPKQMAISGALKLLRHDALKMTGRLFKLRRDVNLVSNVLDVPELFWSEASLKELYDAVREYVEIKPRVQVLNEKLGVASDFLDAIHDHLNNSAMERITWIIIWLIVVACVVELGEVIARLVLHAASTKSMRLAASTIAQPLSREETLRTLERMMVVQS
ncbi:hypothetical protein M413DRAFT_440600 [Hebeloma cylindrosporum]|uniref:DUF155 domain-containing protein n=1 Tax=Hebeloma cylindrosporum TaxID=76867 RepID=A0A0C2YB54_HEBCY|nr:hypothetical protein M413DRAFT_440600 [Hebeloma cylindrosporum h7]